MSTTLPCWAATAASAMWTAGAGADDLRRIPDQVVPHATAQRASPIYGVTIPERYREWELVAVAYEQPFDEFRSILGNPLAMKAFRSGVLPFPNGAVLAKLAWKRVPSTAFDGAFVPGAATTLQIMVKDSAKYATTGGWGFGRFIDGEPVDEGQHRTCFACHQAKAMAHDFVFTRYAN